MDNTNTTAPEKFKNIKTDGAIQPKTSQHIILVLNALQPNSTTTNSTTNTKSFDLTQPVFFSSQALECKQGKYHDEFDQCHDQSKIEIGKIMPNISKKLSTQTGLMNIRCFQISNSLNITIGRPGNTSWQKILKRSTMQLF